jgi:LysM repeat protein
MNRRADRAIVFPDESYTESDDTHVVEKGDTIVRIARNYGVTVRKLREANLGLTDLINAGQRIFIPECSTKPGTVLQRDIRAFAMQYHAKARANVVNGTSSYWQSYLNELVVRYSDINLSAFIESEKI